MFLLCRSPINKKLSSSATLLILANSSSIAIKARKNMCKLYCDHFPECHHKLLEKTIAKIDSHLRGAYVDDMSVETYAPQLKAELSTPNVIHPPKYESMSTREQTELVNIATWCHIFPVLDFCSVQIKKINSANPAIE